MIHKIEAKNLGKSDLGWLKSRFHFSFAEYYNPNNVHFGVLRVLNDDLVEPQTGFDTHPHHDMEIISYVVDGELTHGDSMGNQRTLQRGHVQYMSAGTGVQHNEYNLGNTIARFLQIWIFPDKKGLQPNYGEHRFEWEARKNKWLHLVSGLEGNAPIKIYQDANIFATEIDNNSELNFEIAKDRQAYLLQIEGSSIINEVNMFERDAMEIIEETIKIQSVENSHILIIEMAKY